MLSRVYSNLGGNPLRHTRRYSECTLSILYGVAHSSLRTTAHHTCTVQILRSMLLCSWYHPARYSYR